MKAAVNAGACHQDIEKNVKKIFLNDNIFITIMSGIFGLSSSENQKRKDLA